MSFQFCLKLHERAPGQFRKKKVPSTARDGIFDPVFHDANMMPMGQSTALKHMDEQPYRL